MARSWWMLALLTGCGGGESTAAEVATLRADVEGLTERVERLEAQKSAAPAGRTLSPPGGLLTATQPPSDDARVEALDDQRFAVSLGVLDEDVSGQCRLLPHRSADASVDGARISGVRRSSWLAAAGVKNGDILHTVDGTAVQSATDFGTLVTEAASGDAPGAVEIELTRRGQPLTITWEWRSASRP